MNHHEQRARDRVVSSKVWIEKSKSAGFVAKARAKKRQEADAIKYAQIEKERQAFGVFFEVRNRKSRECHCNESVAWELAKGEAVYFSQPSLYNAARKLGMSVVSYDAAKKTATMIDKDGIGDIYSVQKAGKTLRIQLLKYVFRVAVHPKNGDSSQNI